VYAENEPIRRVDLNGLLTKIYYWKPRPSPTAKAAFGHISIQINGTSYSFTGDGMTVESIENYLILKKI